MGAVDRPVSRFLHRKISRPVARGSSDFPDPDYRNVYQAISGANVTTGVLAGVSGFDFTLSFDLYVISHDATVRPVVGLTSAFTIPAQTGFQLVIRADNQIALSVRDGDAAGTFTSVSLPISTGTWHRVDASFVSDTLTLSVGAAIDAIAVPNRLPAGDLPFQVFGIAAASDQMQISDINLSFSNGLSAHWPCSEGSGLVMKDYVAKDLSSPSNGIISDESIHAIRL